MKKRIVPIAVALATILVLTGCMKNDYTVTVHPDGTANVEISMLLSDSFMAQVGMNENVLLEQALESNAQNFKIDTMAESTGADNYKGVKFSKTCSTVDEIVQALNNTQSPGELMETPIAGLDPSQEASAEVPDLQAPTAIPDPSEVIDPEFSVTPGNTESTTDIFSNMKIEQDKGFFTTSYKFSVDVAAAWAEELEESNQSGFYDLSTMIKSKLNIVMPGTVTASTVEYTKGANAVSLDLVTLKEPTTLEISSEETHVSNILLVATLILLIVIIIAVAYYCKSKKKFSEEDKPHEDAENVDITEESSEEHIGI